MALNSFDILKSLVQIIKSEKLEDEITLIESVQNEIDKINAHNTVLSSKEQLLKDKKLDNEITNTDIEALKLQKEIDTLTNTKISKTYNEELEIIDTIETAIINSKEKMLTPLIERQKRLEKHYYIISSILLLIVLVVFSIITLIHLDILTVYHTNTLTPSLWFFFGLAILIITMIWVVFTIKYFKMSNTISLLYKEYIKINCTINNEINKERFTLIKKYL